ARGLLASRVRRSSFQGNSRGDRCRREHGEESHALCARGVASGASGARSGGSVARRRAGGDGMTANSPHLEELLLDYIYDELPPADARAAAEHLAQCERCREKLDEFRSTRRSMSRLPSEPAPTAGLESLLTYARGV